MQEGISTIITAITNSHKIFRRLETYVIYRIASSLLILGYFFFAILIFDLEMPTWVLVLINLLNDISAMATSLDKVTTCTGHSAMKSFSYYLQGLVQQYQYTMSCVSYCRTATSPCCMQSCISSITCSVHCARIHQGCSSSENLRTTACLHHKNGCALCLPLDCMPSSPLQLSLIGVTAKDWLHAKLKMEVLCRQHQNTLTVVLQIISDSDLASLHQQLCICTGAQQQQAPPVEHEQGRYHCLRALW